MSAAPSAAAPPTEPPVDASAPAPAGASADAPKVDAPKAGLSGAFSSVSGGLSSAGGAVTGAFSSGAGHVMGCGQWLYANIASKLKTFIQIGVTIGILVAIAVYLVQYSYAAATCSTQVPVASLALFAALCIVLLSSLFDMCLEGKKSEGENICVSVWRHLKISLLAWGLTLAALAWLGYELISIWSHMHSSDASTYCQPALWRGMANIFIALIVIFVVYSLLLLVVVIVACIAGNKPKAARVDENGKPLPAAPETTLTKVWQTILNFFGLDELAATAPPAPIVEEAPAPGAKAPAAPADGAEEKLLA
jgi:hypothetical protein